MRIAFDLDNTLIQCGHEFPLEELAHPLLARFVTHERLRAGTRALFRFCHEQGHETWIYTSSLRPAGQIRRTFSLHGIRLHGIVNQATHESRVRSPATKYPPAFGIDVLIDDSPGVAVEGDRHGFPVILIEPHMVSWVADIKSKLIAIHV